MTDTVADPDEMTSSWTESQGGVHDKLLVLLHCDYHELVTLFFQVGQDVTICFEEPNWDKVIANLAIHM